MSEENTFPKKYKTKLPTTFEEECESASEEDLRKKIVQCEGHIYSLDKDKDEDSKLNSAKELVKELSEPYAEAKGIETAKIKFLCYVLESRGVRI